VRPIRRPQRAAIGDTGGAIGIPRPHLHGLADVERRLRGGLRAAQAPAMREDRQHDAANRRNEELDRNRGAEPRGNPAGGRGQPDGQQVERARDQLGADQHRRCDPPRPMRNPLAFFRSRPPTAQG